MLPCMVPQTSCRPAAASCGTPALLFPRSKAPPQTSSGGMTQWKSPAWNTSTAGIPAACSATRSPNTSVSAVQLLFVHAGLPLGWQTLPDSSVHSLLLAACQRPYTLYVIQLRSDTPRHPDSILRTSRCAKQNHKSLEHSDHERLQPPSIDCSNTTAATSLWCFDQISSKA
jgi:hypothetical protein